MYNKFFTTDDIRQDGFIFKLEPNFWWSRIYEYPFAQSFINKDDIVLDACCGIYHPFKFVLSDICKEVYAFDRHDLSKENILKTMEIMFGKSAVEKFDKNYFNKVKLIQCEVTDLPYDDNFFDVITCISALEHFDELTILGALNEFKRVLKDNGKIIITLDYPTLLPSRFIELVKEAQLEIDGDYNYDEIPENAISSTYFGSLLYCYSIILKKPQIKRRAGRPKKLYGIEVVDE